MYVMTIDQRGSSSDVDRVPALLAELADLQPGAHFERSVGDELQGVLTNPGTVVDIALHALRSGRWYVGIGVGNVDRPLPPSPREGAGPAFVAARLAVERAKAASSHVPLAVAAGGPRRGTAAAPGPAGTDRGTDTGPGARECANAEAVLRLIGRVVLDRTAAQWKVVDVLRGIQDGRGGTHGSVHGTQKAAAGQLGITEQSVSRALLRSGWQEEWAARPAAEMLLALADGLTAGTDNPARPTLSEGDR